MYRDDSEALHARADAATAEVDRLRRENEAMRIAVANQGHPVISTLAMQPAQVYGWLDPAQLPLVERSRLANHQLRQFPVWATGILNFITFGLFGLIHFGLMHDRLPRAAHNDPSAGKAIGFQFIPYFNLYWVFFNSLRFCDRLTMQYRVRGIRRSAPRGLATAASIFTVIPYLNILIGIPIMWTITTCMLQHSVNEIAALPPTSWDATSPR
jgi:hypothetical protein